MRLATLAVAVVVIVGMTPALAHTAQEADEEDSKVHSPENSYDSVGYHQINASTPYVDEIVVDDMAYLKAGWWDGDRRTDGFGVNQSGTHDEEDMIWLELSTGTTDPEFPYEVTVTVNGTAAAALDVFQLRDAEDGTSLTPNCPQFLVDERLPRENEGSDYAFRVLRDSTQRHQRAHGLTNDGEMNVQLQPERGPYIVAVYPQAGSNLLHSTTEIDVKVEASQNDRFVLRDGLESADQPEAPFHTEEWVGKDQILHCQGEGIRLPPPLDDATAAEFPGTGSLEERIAPLMETTLEETDGGDR